MPKFYFLLITIVCLLFTDLKSQSITRSVVSSEGNSFTNKDIRVDWTMGEVSIEGHVLNNVVLTQGFHQPMVSIVGIKDNKEQPDLLTIFPNPTKDFVNYNFAGSQKITSISIYTTTGILLDNIVAINDFKSGTIDLTDYSGGSYFVKFAFNDQSFQIHKILKIKS